MRKILVYIFFIISLTFLFIHTSYISVVAYKEHARVIQHKDENICQRQVDPLYIMVNIQRQKRGLNPLTIDSGLQMSASIKACDLRNRHYWSHEDPDGNMPWELIRRYYTGNPIGENLAKDYYTDDGIMAGWMGSKTHKANILKDNYTHIGIGRCGEFVVQHFGGNL